MEAFKLNSYADSLEISCLLSLPEGEPRGVVQIVHGMCEHKERYIAFMDYLAGHGFACVIHDHRGHGGTVRSAADLGYMYKGGWNALIEDTRIVAEYAAGRFPGIRKIMLGHSMGSMVARSFAKRYDSMIDCLVVCGSPSSNPAGRAGKLLARAVALFKGDRHRSGMLQKLSFGSFNKGFKKDGYASAWVCSDKQVLEDYHNDPLCQFIFTANGFINLISLMQYCYSLKGWKIANPQLMVRFISGADDPCRLSDKDFEKSVGHMRKAGYNDVSAISYPGMRHEILNESGKAQVWADVLGFCEETVRA